MLNNSDAKIGQKGFTITLGGLSAAPTVGGSLEFVTGAGGAGADTFTYVISNSSYAPANGRGELGVSRGALGSTAAAHDGLTNIVRYAHKGDLTLGAAVADAAATTITVSSISNLDTGGFMIVGDEIMEVVTFPSSTSCTVNRGAEGTTATAHSDGITVHGLSLIHI